MGTVPIIAPDGTLGDVPFAHMMDAIKAGGKPGVTVKSPDGKLGVVPSDRMSDAVKAGGTIVPLEDQETQHPGFWSTLATDAGNLGKGILSAGSTALRTLGGDPTSAQEMMKSTAGILEGDEARKAAGYNPVYRVIAPLGALTGTDVPTMEAHAAHGDVAAVAADATAPLAAIGASEAVAHGGPAAVKAAQPYFDAVKDAVGDITPKQAAQGVGAVSGAAAGHGTLSPAGAYYGAKTAGKIVEGVLGKDRANAPLVTKPAFVDPGAPLPEVPAEMQSEAAAQALPDAFQARASKPPAVPGTVDQPFQSPAQPVSPESRLPSAFQPRPPSPRTPPAVSGTIDQPFKSLVELPPAAVEQAIQEVGAGSGIAQITERANKIALGKQLGDQLGDAVGYKPPALTPGKPIYQRPAYTPEAPASVPDGMTPVESSALRSYGYDPESGTFTAQMRSGSMYRWAEVTPDEAKAFADAKSKGTALQDIRNNHVNTAANYGQGWIDRIPNMRSASPTDVASGNESESAGATAAPSGDLTATLQKMLAEVRRSGKLPSSGVSNATAPTANSSAAPVSSQPANRGLTQSPALYEPRQPELPTAPGAPTNIKVPGSDQSYPARYEVRELGDVQPSHNGGTFQANPKYALTNDRDYANPANQAKVVDNSAAGKFDPSYHLTDNPDATNGPIVIDSDGHALAGNGRAMILQRVYKQNPEGAAQYRMMLANKSPQFGVDPLQVLRMKEPVLVRQIADEDLPHSDAKQTAITDFNKVGTAQLTPAERAISDSRRVSQGTLDAISAHLEAQGPDASLTDALQGASGTSILNRLIDDGVISPQEKAGLATESGLTSAAKERIAKLTVGRFFRDPAQMDQTPLSIRNKLEAIAAPLARVDNIPGWDLTPHVQSALDLLGDARAHNISNLMDVVSQSRLFGDEQYSPKAIALAEQLKSGGTRSLVKQLRQYAQDAQNASGSQQSFASPVTPQQSFREAFQH